MPKVEHQCIFTHVEVVEALIRQAGIHEGKWQLGMAVASTPTNVQVSPTDHAPGVVLHIMNLLLVPAIEVSPPSLVVDASVVNPRMRAN